MRTVIAEDSVLSRIGLVKVLEMGGCQVAGVRAAMVIRRRWPRTAVVLLSQYAAERYAADLLATNTSGVGYLLKQRAADVGEFVETVQFRVRWTRWRRASRVGASSTSVPSSSSRASSSSFTVCRARLRCATR